MNTELDRALRRTLREISDAPAPADLAEKAIRLAQRRRRDRIVAGAAAVVVVALAVSVPLVLRPERQNVTPIAPTPSASPSTPSPLTGPPRVVAFAYAGVDGGSYILDRAGGEYRKIPYEVAVPSPDGRRFFVGDGARGGIIDGAFGSVRWVDAYDSYTTTVEWSPDGDRLLISRLGKDDPGGFSIVDAMTAEAAEFVPMADMERSNAKGLGFFWTRDGRGIGHTLSVAAGESNPDKVIGIRFYDLSGRPSRTVPVDGFAEVRDGLDISPDSSRAAAVQHGRGQQHVMMIDLVTGAAPAAIEAGDVLGWYDDEHLVVRADEALEVIDLAGSSVRSVPGSAALLAAHAVHLIDVAGLPEASARYAF